MLPTQRSNVDMWIVFVCYMIIFFFFRYYLLLIQRSGGKKNVSKELIKLKLKWNTGWKCSCSNNSMKTRISWEPFIIWILYYLSVKLIWENKFLFCRHNDFEYLTMNYQKSYSHWLSERRKKIKWKRSILLYIHIFRRRIYQTLQAKMK